MLSLLVGALIGAGWSRLLLKTGNCPKEKADELYLICIGRGLGFAVIFALAASVIVNINWQRTVEQTTVTDPVTARILVEKCDETDNARVKLPANLVVITPAPGSWLTKLWLLADARPDTTCKITSSR